MFELFDQELPKLFDIWKNKGLFEPSTNMKDDNKNNKAPVCFPHDR